MKFKVFSELSYEVKTETVFVFNIQVAESIGQSIISESFKIVPEIKFEEFKLINNEARFIKLIVPALSNFTISYEAIVEVKLKFIDFKELIKISLIDLPHEILPFIAPSRHCESDKVWFFSKETFDYLPTQYEKVIAINKWIFHNIRYETGSTGSSSSAYDTFCTRVGVCKDFAHLGIALCRALDIPARYFTGYASNLNPPDFHGCYEVYIGGYWLFFDPTKMANAKALVKIADGKDASEIPVASYFGDTFCSYMKIECFPIDSTVLIAETLDEKAVSYGI